MFEIEPYLLFIIFIIIDFGLYEAIDFVDFVIWFVYSIAEAAGLGNVFDYYLVQIFYLWWFYSTIVKWLEIMNKSDLAWLADSFAISEPS